MFKLMVQETPAPGNGGRHPFEVRQLSSDTWRGISAAQASDVCRRFGTTLQWVGGILDQPGAVHVLTGPIGKLAIRRTPSAAEAETARAQLKLI